MNLDIIAAICLALALVHTFAVKNFARIALRYPEGSVGENFFHLMAEVEVVFGIWAALFVSFFVMLKSRQEALLYLESCNFTEPLFVFVIMTICSSRPILALAEKMIFQFSSILPMNRQLAFYWATLVLGPLLGSLITEPAAMTVTALILFQHFYKKGISTKLMYSTIGLLFVNVSIGGTLTPFAAPPVLMVAAKWNWDLPFMLTHFGWKAVIASVVSTSLIAFRFRKELLSLGTTEIQQEKPLPLWLTAIHVLFLFAVVASVHHSVVFIALFLFFLGLVTVTREFQSELKMKEGLLVAFFLGGIVVLGGSQKWWLEQILARLDSFSLYLGAIGLTAITDNAALTFLGSQVATLSETSKFALVAGSVVGGGLTVIANAPNPAGYGILNSSFGAEGIAPLKLLSHALLPTLVAAVCFWCF